MNRECCGQPNPEAPTELECFSFLVGLWNCAGKVKCKGDEWKPFTAEWFGRYILDGMAIADEFRATFPDGKLFMHGQNIRMYNPEQKAWKMKWIDALDATVIKQGGPELGGVKANGATITFHILHDSGDVIRARYSNITDDSFEWHGALLGDDGETWDEVMVIEARRA